MSFTIVRWQQMTFSVNNFFFKIGIQIVIGIGASMMSWSVSDGGNRWVRILVMKKHVYISVRELYLGMI